MNHTQTSPDAERKWVRFDRRGPVVLVTIDRPERRNALNRELKSELADVVELLGGEDEVKVIVITGSSSSFVAGSDVSEMQSMTPIVHTLEATDRLFRVVRGSRKVIIAAVEGYALGGGNELAMSCDLIVAGESSKFGQPEIRLGVVPGAGGTQRLARTVGKFRALRLLLTGDTLSAREALGAGLVSDVVDDGQAVAHSLELAERIAAMPPLAVAATRELVTMGEDMPFEAAMSLERKVFQILFDSADQKEGMHAFLEKRPPNYEGR
jgi:enoyl-CoA hydratase